MYYNGFRMEKSQINIQTCMYVFTSYKPSSPKKQFINLIVKSAIVTRCITWLIHRD